MARRTTRRVWTSLTLAAALLPTADGATAAPFAGDHPLRAVPLEGGPFVQLAAAGAEGGEGGEAGIDAGKAATDPVTFIIALDVMAAHVHAGLAAYAAGQSEAGAEMFAHALSEIYADLEPTLVALGVPPFEDALARGRDLALAGKPVDEIGAAAAKIFAALNAAEAKAPPAPQGTDVETAVFCEILDRSALQYGRAVATKETDSYLDGFGFAVVGKSRGIGVLKRLGDKPEALKAATDALAAVEKAYATITPPAQPAIEPSALLAATSNLKLHLGSN